MCTDFLQFKTYISVIGVIASWFSDKTPHFTYLAKSNISAVKWLLSLFYLLLLFYNHFLQEQSQNLSLSKTIWIIESCFWQMIPVLLLNFSKNSKFVWIFATNLWQLYDLFSNQIITTFEESQVLSWFNNAFSSETKQKNK